MNETSAGRGWARQPMRAVWWDSGSAREVVGLHDTMGVCLQVYLDDGREVQLIVSADGSVHLRGWPCEPMSVGNATELSLHAQLPLIPRTPTPSASEPSEEERK